MALNEIIIEIPNSLKSQYDGNSFNDRLFQSSDPSAPLDSLVLQVFPDSYTPEFTFEDSGVSRGFNQNFVIYPTRFYSFTATCRATQEAVWYILNEIIETAKTESQTDPTSDTALVQIRDYLLVDPGDSAQGYSVRKGVLNIKPSNGSVRSGTSANSDRNYINAFELEFIQV